MSPRALVVDDSLPGRLELRSILSKAEFQISACGTKALAWSMINKESVSLVVLAARLPDGPGAELIRMIRSDARFASIKIILIASDSDAQARVAGMAAGADRCISRPYEPDYLGQIAKDLCMGDGPQRFRYLLQSQKILVVDDSPTFAAAAREYLRCGGNEVVVATSGEEALELIKNEPFACVFLDLTLPGIDGHTTCQRLRKLRHGRDALVLAVTASDDPEVREKAIQAGCDEVAIKAPTMENLRVQMRSLLRRKRIERERFQTGTLP